MPELPEVETIKRQLARRIKGKTIRDAEVRLVKLIRHPVKKFKKLVEGAKVVGVNRRGKLILIELSKGVVLVIHLKLSGQLVFNGKGSKHTHLIYHFADKSKLLHNDLRKFGFVKVVEKDKLNDFFEKEKMGLEPLKSDFTFKRFRQLLSKRKKSKIKLALMDQSLFVGIGNIYANEILFASGVHPQRTVGSLMEKEIKKIYRNIKSVLTFAIKKKGASDRDYVDAGGQKGSYMKFAKVYNREGKPCLKCGTKIKRVKFSGRSSYFCEKCQN